MDIGNSEKQRTYWRERKRRERAANPEYHKEYRKKNAHKFKEYQERYAASEKGLLAKQRKWARRLKKEYGITPEVYEELFKNQKGVCKICLHPPEKKKLAVDHDHETGQVRGLLCFGCNVFIGIASEDSEVLRRAILYLQEGKNGN